MNGGMMGRLSTETLMSSVILLLVIFGGGYDEGRRRRPFIIRGAYSAASPLSGTKRSYPWAINQGEKVNVAGYSNIPTKYDVFQNTDLTKLLDVGACLNQTNESPARFSYVPPLDGTIPSQTVCRDVYGMRFVLFDLQLVNLAEIDSLSGSFTAQLQLVFHWREGWEQLGDSTTQDFFVYTGDIIESADNASTCSFVCDTTSAVKKCCDGMWVPQLQLPSCKINDVQSVVPPPYLRTTDSSQNVTSFWHDDSTPDYMRYSTRRTWYVGLDVTCPFSPEFHYFPFDYQLLTIDIINPYASRTWLQLNKGFLQANIIDSIAGINLSPDKKIDGWRIKDLIVSSACGSQQTWKPTFFSQDYLLELLGVGYKSQKGSIQDALSNLACAKIIDLNLTQENGTSFTNPTNKQPYNQTKSDYLQRLNDTIEKYEECNAKSEVPSFTWNTSITNNVSNTSNMPQDIWQFNVVDHLNVERSFNFLDFEFQQDPIHGIDFRCAIEAVANLTTPGIRINIVTQRYKMYYWVKLISPTCACVAFTFLAFGLKIEDMVARLTVVVPSAIALSTLQGFVISTDIPAIAYMAPTTWIVLTSYIMQLLIALESIYIKHKYSSMKKNNEEGKPTTRYKRFQWRKYQRQANATGPDSLKVKAKKLRKLDVRLGIALALLYISVLCTLVIVPHFKSMASLKSRGPMEYESLWAGQDKTMIF